VHLSTPASPREVEPSLEIHQPRLDGAGRFLLLIKNACQLHAV